MVLKQAIITLRKLFGVLNRIFSPSEEQIRYHNRPDQSARRHNVHRRPATSSLAFLLGGQRAVGDAADPLVVRLFCEQAYDNHHDRTYDENQQAEVLEVDFVDDPKERSLGVLKALFDFGHGIHGESKHSHQESDDQGPQATLGIEAFPKDAEEEHDKNWRGQIALHRLQVVVQARASP